MKFLGFAGTREAGPARRSALALPVSICLSMAARSAEVLNASVIEREGRYIMHSETLVQASVAEVRRILTDYENLPRVNRALKRVVILEHRENSGVRMGVVSEFCVLAICLNLAWSQDVRAWPNEDISLIIVPNRGDFRQGSGRWRLLPDDDGTRLIFDAELTPNIWIPPAIGPWLMKGKIAEEAFETARELERIATPD